jgi:hypothetical protein
VLAQTWTSSSTYRIIKYAAKDFSLISVDFKPVSENGSTCSVESRDLINSLQNCLGIEELPSRRDTTNAKRLWMGRQSDAYYDGMLVVSFVDPAYYAQWVGGVRGDV